MTHEHELNESGIRKQIAALAELNAGMHDRDFLLTWQHSDAEIRSVVLLAEILEGLFRGNCSFRAFEGGLAVSIFRDQSTRTRFSFAGAANLVGLAVQELDEAKSQIAHGETVRETANMISFTNEIIGIRDDMFLGEGHRYMAEVATALDEGHREGVLGQRPAVINLQCDLDHPTQSLADLCHLKSMFGSLEALRGKKLAMTWAHSPSYGKPLSVPQGIVTLMTRFGMNVVLAHPEGYDLVPETLEAAARHAGASGGGFEQTASLETAFKDADIVYPKSWAPMAVMQERTRLLRAGDSAALKELERQALAENARHQNWECTEDMMSHTRDGKALYMHCLPADITGVSCKAGEVSAGVFERYRLDTYREAGHKPFVIAAMMLLTRIEKPAAFLENVLDRRRPRRIG